MFNIPAITWTLTAGLLLSAGYHLLQAIRSPQLTDRANKSLHALMNILMTAVLWNLIPSTMLAQIAVLTGGAMWFVLQAVARPEFKILCAGSQGRLKCVYHSLTMAGAALMIGMMGHAATIGHEMAPAASTSSSHAHHSGAPAAPSTAVPGLVHASDLAMPLTVFFAAAAVVFLILLLRARAAKAAVRDHAAPRHSLRAEHGHEALGAAVMALMFATMSS
ncbi:UNVERIFIED_ORG: hypothetical protein ABIB52_004327 [Arthrobacter sp. UYCu721]